MTGVVVCVLGKTGINFRAGMTGGFAYVLDTDQAFKKRLNAELVEGLCIVDIPTHQEHLRGLIEEHVRLTRSAIGEQVLSNWDDYIQQFVLIKPIANDVNALLGHRRRSANEIRLAAQ